MATAEMIRAVIARLLHKNGFRDTVKNQKRMVEKYLSMPEHVPETDDEKLLWKILNTSEDVVPTASC